MLISTTDASHVRWPITAMFDKKVAMLKEIVHIDGKYSTRQTACVAGISLAVAKTSLKRYLKVRKIFARLVSKLLLKQ
jgi:hypothetical protein